MRGINKKGVRAKLAGTLLTLVTAASAQGAVDLESRTTADRAPASEDGQAKEATQRGQIAQQAVDPVTRALYQSLDERARSESEFERHEAVGRPKENSNRRQLRIDLGDELGSSHPVMRQESKFHRSEQARHAERTASIRSIETRLDEETRGISNELGKELGNELRRERDTQTREPRDSAKSRSSNSHWIDRN